MSNPQPVTLTFAGVPFENPAADVVIRSPDGVHFRVRSAIISEASPVFSVMLTSDQIERTTDGKRLLVVAEDSTVLDPLLRLCYPVTDPVFADLKDVRLVLAAAMKYQMTEACTLLKKQLRSYMDDQPLRVWASACLLRFEEEAKAAALALFGKEFPVKAPPEFEQVSSGDYFRLTSSELVEMFQSPSSSGTHSPRTFRSLSKRGRNGTPCSRNSGRTHPPSRSSLALTPTSSVVLRME
uniref:DNA ligase (EC) n=1 Tax=Ganoderma boninense TaxID=34458 RepID=A0A5K1JS62_9APHY|nr:DNA ligase (EC [Ganoderma boninense]